MICNFLLINMSAISGRFDFGFFMNLEFKGTKTVLDWCQIMNLISNEYECPECNLQMKLEEKADDIDGYVWICRGGKEENEHFIERSLRQGSFLQQQSNLSIIKILLLTYLWIKKATCEFIEDELDLPKTTVEEYLRFCREICVEICFSKNTTLGGKDVLVEIDECKFQKKKLKKTDYVLGEWVYAGFEKETDKGFLEVVQNNNEIELLNVIKKYILPGTILVSDCWKLYDCLQSEEFKKLRKTQGIKFADIGVGAATSVLGLRTCVKRSLKGVPRISRDFDIYVAEYMWRRTHSDIPYELINSFLQEITTFFPPVIKDSQMVC